MAGQAEFVFGEFVPLNWKQAEKEHVVFCLEKSLASAYLAQDFKAVAALTNQLTRMQGWEAPRKIDLDDNRKEIRTREDMEAKLREKGLDPALIAAEVFK